MHLKKFFGSKKIFWLIFTPIIIIESIVYSEYLDGKNRSYDGCAWRTSGPACKNYLDYIGKDFGGWELHIIGHLLFILATFLLLASVYFLANNKNKISLVLFILLLSLTAWFLIMTGWF